MKLKRTVLQATCRGIFGLPGYLLLCCLWAVVCRAELVITEINFDPADGEGVVRPELEFVEIFNDGSEPYDLSGYRFTRGISLVFPERTFIRDGAYMVVCRDQEAVQARYGISNTIGDFIGTLDNSGETIELANPQGVGVSRVSYNDRGQWPGGAKGTGHTLSIKKPYSDCDDPDSWKLSAEMGGTPGRTNFNTEVSFVDSVLIPDNSTWSFFRGRSNPPGSWRELDFDDSDWESGPTGIGYGDGTPLMAAVNYQLTGAVTLLLQHGADPNLPSPLTGETPLHIAALRGFGKGSTECAELLLDAGANPNVTTNVDVVTPSMASGTTVIGETPLHWAAAFGSQRLIKLLIDAGADKSATDARGDTPLIWYGRHQRTSPHILVEHGTRDLLD